MFLEHRIEKTSEKLIRLEYHVSSFRIQILEHFNSLERVLSYSSVSDYSGIITFRTLANAMHANLDAR